MVADWASCAVLFGSVYSIEQLAKWMRCLGIPDQMSIAAACSSGVTAAREASHRAEERRSHLQRSSRPLHPCAIFLGLFGLVSTGISCPNCPTSALIVAFGVY